MNELISKIKKISSLIKIRKITYMNEVSLLNKIREEKNLLFQTMKISQQKYLQGVDELNKIRTSRTRTNIDNFESSVDYLKVMWFSNYKKFKESEQKELIQINKLLEAEKNLKVLENISDKFQNSLKDELNRHEQKRSDEFTIMKNQLASGKSEQ